jgi:hypothetical protein
LILESSALSQTFSPSGALLPLSLQHRSTFNPVLRQFVAAKYCHTGNHESTGLGAIHDSHIRPEQSGVCTLQTNLCFETESSPLERHSNAQHGATRYLALYPRPFNNLLLVSIRTNDLPRKHSATLLLFSASFPLFIMSYHDTHDTPNPQIDSS